AGPDGVAQPVAPAARGARGDPGRPATPADGGVQHDLRAAGRGGRDTLPGGARLRPSPRALSRPRQNSPPARRYRGRHERGPARQLAGRDPAGADSPLPLRGIGSRRMMGANSPTVSARGLYPLSTSSSIRTPGQRARSARTSRLRMATAP